MGNNELIMSGITSEFEKVPGSIKFEAKVKIVAKGGSISASEGTLNVSNADEVTFYISIATNFVNYHDVSGNEEARVNGYLQKALKRNYDQILKRSRC